MFNSVRLKISRNKDMLVANSALSTAQVCQFTIIRTADGADAENSSNTNLDTSRGLPPQRNITQLDYPKNTSPKSKNIFEEPEICQVAFSVDATTQKNKKGLGSTKLTNPDFYY
jgi:hypothetical protein